MVCAGGGESGRTPRNAVAETALDDTVSQAAFDSLRLQRCEGALGLGVFTKLHQIGQRQVVKQGKDPMPASVPQPGPVSYTTLRTHET